MALKRWLLSAGIYCTSEIISQQIASNLENKKQDISKQRIVIGATMDSFFLYNFHKIVDTTFSVAWKKGLTEQLVFSPFSNVVFLYFSNNLSLNNFLSLYRDDCCFWPFASYIGYTFVGTKYRFVYASTCSLMWNNWRIYNYAEVNSNATDNDEEKL